MVSDCSKPIFQEVMVYLLPYVWIIQTLVDSAGRPAGNSVSSELGVGAACISHFASTGRQARPSYQCAPAFSAHRPGPVHSWQERGLLRNLQGFGFGTVQGCTHTETSSVSSGPAGRCLHGRRRWGKSGGKVAVLTAWLTAWGRVSVFRGPSRGVAWCGKLWVLVSFVCGAVSSVLLWLVMFHFPGSLLRGLSFPWCMSLAALA